MGSWKIMPILLPRQARISSRESCARSVPSSTILAGGWGSRPMIESAVIDLPQPDSPTTASVSPRRMTRERLRMAGSAPSSVKSVTDRSSTSRRTSARAVAASCCSATSSATSRSSALTETLVSDMWHPPS